MTNQKHTKRALLSSMVSLVLCFAMLLGTTFAWFTDTASTSVNKIQAGTLDVDIVDTNRASLQGNSLTFQGINGEQLWEPGVTFNTNKFMIENKGNLALKYQIILNGANGDAELLNVIDFKICKADGTAVDLNNFEGTLIPEAVSEAYYITGTMKKEAGNGYQGKSLDGIGITVVAAQYTYESDSNGNDYDKEATYPTVVATTTDLFNAVKNAKDGDTVVLGADITLDKILTVDKTITLDLNGHTITTDKNADEYGWNDGNWSIISVRGGELTVIGNGTILGVTGVTYGADVRDGGTLIIENGSVYGSFTAVYAHEGSVIINGGTFGVTNPESSNGSRFVLNCLDANYENGTAKIEVNGGTFVGFNPANNNAEGNGTNFVSDGNQSFTLNGSYYVVPADATLAANSTDLSNAINNGGTVILTNDIAASDVISISKDVTIYGYGNTITAATDKNRIFNVEGTSTDISIKLYDLTMDASNVERGISFHNNSGNISLEMDGCTVTADHYAVNVAKENKNITVNIKNSNITGYCAAQTYSENSKLTFENCILTGVNKWSGQNNDFGTINVVAFDENTGATGSIITLNNCNINAVEKGDAEQYLFSILVNASVTATNCTFTHNGTPVAANNVTEHCNNCGEATLTIK